MNGKTKGNACAGCALSARREFMADTLGIAAGVLVVLGAPSSLAAFATGDILGEVSGHTVSYPIPAADGTQIDRANQVILVRWQGTAYAFALSCPHQNQALRWIEKDARFQCPKHKSRYTPDGTFISGRATRGLDRYAVTRAENEIVVDLATLHEQTADPSVWNAAKLTLT